MSDDEAVRHSASIVRAITAAWSEIRRHHGDVPVVTVTFGSGSLGARAQVRKLGHFAAERWSDGGDEMVHEMFVSAEHLADGPVEVLGTLLHEGGHGVAHTRGVQDTSNRGRYHNDRFAKIVRAMGLDVRKGAGKEAKYGWQFTSIPDRTVKRYNAAIDALGEACRLWRLAEPEEAGRTSRPSVPMMCSCGRRISAAEKVARAAPMRCHMCLGLFTPLNAWLESNELSSWIWEDTGVEHEIVRTPLKPFFPPEFPAFSSPDGPWLLWSDDPDPIQESLFSLEDIPIATCRKCRQPVEPECFCARRARWYA